MIPDQFKTGVRCLLLLHRNKDGGTQNVQRKAPKIVTNSIKEWNDAFEGLIEIKNKLLPEHRIYSCVNERDPKKAIREFKRLQLDHDYECDEMKESFYMDCENRFFSCLMQPNARKDSLFLIDCDLNEQFIYTMDNLGCKVVYHCRSRNGWHVVTEPFNPSDVNQALTGEIKKDALIYLG